MADISTLPFRSTPFTGAPSAVQPVIPNQIFHATDTNTLYIADSLALGDISEYGGGSGGGGGSSVTVGTVTPIGNVTPSAANEIYIWEDVNGSTANYVKTVYYYSTGTTNTDWEAYGGSAIVHIDGGSPFTGADFIGQHYYVLQSGSLGPQLNSEWISYQVGQGGGSNGDWVQVN